MRDEQFPVTLKVKWLDKELPIPDYESARASGIDLYAARDIIIEPGQTVRVPTGVAIQLPNHHLQSSGVLYEGQIRPRSGMTDKTKLRIGNSPGTIDNDYRGELEVIIDNIAQREHVWSHEISALQVLTMPNLRNIKGELIPADKSYPLGTYIIKKGQRFAQFVVAIAVQANIQIAVQLDETSRGKQGFGHTGI